MITNITITTAKMYVVKITIYKSIEGAMIHSAGGLLRAVALVLVAVPVVILAVVVRLQVVHQLPLVRIRLCLLPAFQETVRYCVHLY